MEMVWRFVSPARKTLSTVTLIRLSYSQEEQSRQGKVGQAEGSKEHACLSPFYPFLHHIP